MRQIASTGHRHSVAATTAPSQWLALAAAPSTVAISAHRHRSFLVNPANDSRGVNASIRSSLSTRRSLHGSCTPTLTRLANRTRLPHQSLSLKSSLQQSCCGMASSTSDDARHREGNPDKIAFALNGVTKKLPGGRQLFSNVSLSFLDGAKIGILGANGSGKSSLLKIIAGVDKEFQGEARSADGYRVGYLPQEPVLDASKTVMENVMDGLKYKFDLVKQFEDISAMFGDADADMDALMEQQSTLQAEIERLDCWDLSHKIEIAMDALRCPPADSSVVNLSGGERRRVALARLLLSQPDILLLDEPTNHLDAESVAWLEKFLDTYRGLVVAITHDRYFLDNVVGWILEIDHGQTIPFRGNYQGWLAAKRDRLTLEAKKEVKAAKILDRELTWLQRGSSAVTKGKARVAKIEDMKAQREAQRASRRSEGGALIIPQGPRLGQEGISVDNLSMEIDGRRLFSGVSFRIDEGTILGVIGPNGSGKTTLIKLLTGEMKPAVGSVKIGDTVTFAYNKQTRESLNDENTVWKEICGTTEHIEISAGKTLLARAYVAQFNFGGTDQQKKIHQLSGGERNRVQLAKSLAQGANVILLDEPTNDLDVGTLRALEEALNDFDGAALIVSHDRYFLDRVATHILAFDDDGNHTYSAGNYSEWERDHRGKDGAAAGKKRFKKVA